jgi:hypothetical protein
VVSYHYQGGLHLYALSLASASAKTRIDGFPPCGPFLPFGAACSAKARRRRRKIVANSGQIGPTARGRWGRLLSKECN